MKEKRDDDGPGGRGVNWSLRVIVAVAVLVVAGGAVLYLLGLLSPEVFRHLVSQTLLVGGVAAVTALVLGWLASGRR